MAIVTKTIGSTGADYTSFADAITNVDTDAASGDTLIWKPITNLTENVDIDVAGSNPADIIVDAEEDLVANWPILTGGIQVTHNDIPVHIEGMIFEGGQNVSGIVAGIYGHAGTTNEILTANRVIIRDITGAFNNTHIYPFGLRQMGGWIQNFLIYNISRSGTNDRNVYGVKLSDGSRTAHAYNGLIDGITNQNGVGDCEGVNFTDNANQALRNVAVTDITGNGTGTDACFQHSSPSNADVDYVASDDSTHSGSNSVAVNRTTDYEDADAEDYTLASGSALENEGEDLGTTDDVNFSLNKIDRSDAGVSWDISPYAVAAAGSDALLLLEYQSRIGGKQSLRGGLR